MTTQKEKLNELAAKIDLAKKLLSEAAIFAVQNNLDFTLNLYGAEFDPSVIETSDEDEARWLKEEFGFEEGQGVWVNSSTFC